MNETNYLYQIIRYVPDLERMEPQNIGVVVQGEHDTLSKIWTFFRPLGDKPDFDYGNFKKWREFFDAEVNGPQVSMFQPPRNSPEFLEYLQSRCRSNYLLTRPLGIVMRTESVEEVRDYLFQRLVRSPEADRVPSIQPVRRFREHLQERKLDKHPRWRQDEYIELPNGDAELFKWQYQKNHGSNQRVIIEPVQWRDSIRMTQIELDHVLSAAQKLKNARLNAHLIILLDEIAEPSENAKESSKRHLYDNYRAGKEILRSISDEVISSAPQSEQLVARIEQDLKLVA